MTAPRPAITQLQALEAVLPMSPPEWYHESPVKTLAFRHGVAWKVAYRKLERLADKGLIEYGVSVWYPWRTPEGEARLAELRTTREGTDG